MNALSLRSLLRGCGGSVRREKLVSLVLVGFAALTFTVPARAQNYKVENINVPGAGGTFLGGTSVWHVNNLGEMGGWYGINDGNVGSFVRYQDGRIVTFNSPKQGNGPTSGTWAMGLNDQGDTTGVIFQQTYGFYQNFIRKADGTFITFPQPGLCATQVDNGCMGYGASQINDLGMVAGTYLDDNRVYRSFIRYPNGRMESFDAPGATSTAGSYGGTQLDIGVANVMNQLGAITGTYSDDSGLTHGFVRWPNSTFSTFDVSGPGVAQPIQGTFPQSINDLGVVVGYYIDANGLFHGFTRQLNGKMTSFDAPDGGTAPGSYTGTLAVNLNIFGEIVGIYTDAAGHGHNFIRYPNGKIYEFDPPGYVNDAEAFGINAEGVVVGNSVNDDIGTESGRYGFALVPKL
jgi:hypothetical protein